MLKTPLFFLGADHAGFALKEALETLLDKKGISYVDVCARLDPKDDYPLIGAEVAKNVAATQDAQGIILCGTGIGIAMAANRIIGARAVVAQNPEDAKIGRAHNHANILALGGRTLSAKKLPAILEAWLKTKPDKAARHLRRVNQLDSLV